MKETLMSLLLQYRVVTSLALGIAAGMAVSVGLRLIFNRLEEGEACQTMGMAVDKAKEKSEACPKAESSPKPTSEGFLCYEVGCTYADGKCFEYVGVMAKGEAEAMDAAEKSLAEGKHLVDSKAVTIRVVERI